MLRTLVWLPIFGLLLYLSFLFSVWHLAAQIALIAVLFAWALVGVLLFNKSIPQRSARGPIAVTEIVQKSAAIERAQYAARFGEDAARKVDGEQPDFWMRMAQNRERAK
jgi:hypothetical protein